MSDTVTDTRKYKQGWKGGLPETPCGYGSTLNATKKQRKWIPQIIKQYQIESIADIGAGDLNWIKHTDLSGVEYQAYDLFPRNSGVKKFDLVREVPPKVDMLMVLWVLNHFPMDDCRKAIENIRASGSKYLMMTDRPKYHPNQPAEIQMDWIAKMDLNNVGDSIMLVKLC